MSGLVERLNQINDRLDMSNALTRIKSEILPKASNFIWYDGFDSKPKHRLWSLESREKTRPFPVADFSGIEVSFKRILDSYEEITSKCHVADDVDEDVREQNRRRVSDIEPYICSLLAQN